MASKDRFGEQSVNKTGMLMPANPSLFTRKCNNFCFVLEWSVERVCRSVKAGNMENDH